MAPYLTGCESQEPDHGLRYANLHGWPLTFSDHFFPCLFPFSHPGLELVLGQPGTSVLPWSFNLTVLSTGKTPFPDSHVAWMSAYGEAFPDVILHQSYLLTLPPPASCPSKVLIII